MIFVVIPGRTVLFRLLAHTFDSNFDNESDSDSDAYITITPPETPISLISSL